MKSGLKLRFRHLFLMYSLVYAVLYLFFFSYLPVRYWPDSYGYLIFSEQLWSGDADFRMLFLGRGPSLPIVYALFRSHTVIIYFQVAAYLASFLFLGYACSVFYRGAIRWLVIFFITAMSFGSNLFFWPFSFLSEAVSIATINVLLALLLLCFRSQDRRRKLFLIIVILVAGLFFSHLRDAHMHLVFILVAPLAAAVSADRRLLVAVAAMGLIFTANLFLQQRLIAESGRYRIPLTNVIGKRILGNERLKQWFVSQGMPLNEGVMTYYDHFAYDTVAVAGEKAFGDFLEPSVMGIYQKFLVTHPDYFFQPLFMGKLSKINDPLISYSQNSRRPAIAMLISDALWFPWKACLVILLLLGLMVLLVFRPPYIVVTSFIFSVLGTVIVLLICYHGDANEIARHCMLPAYMLRIFCIMLFFYAADAICRRLSPGVRITSRPGNLPSGTSWFFRG